jgi:hypothetical protein
MKLKEYVDNLNKLISERPEVSDFDVVTNQDDEDNRYNLVHYSPNIDSYNEKDREFTEEKELNAVCVN